MPIVDAPQPAAQIAVLHLGHPSDAKYGTVEMMTPEEYRKFAWLNTWPRQRAAQAAIESSESGCECRERWGGMNKIQIRKAATLIAAQLLMQIEIFLDEHDLATEEKIKEQLEQMADSLAARYGLSVADLPLTTDAICFFVAQAKGVKG